MKEKKFYYIFDDSVKLFEIYEKDDKLFVDEECENECSLDFNEDNELFVSWYVDCEIGYDSEQLYPTKAAATEAAKESLKKRIEFLQKKLAALE